MPKNRTTKLIFLFFVFVFAISAAWTYLLRNWISRDEREIHAFLQQQLSKSDEASFEGFLQESWDRVCILVEYDDTHPGHFGNAPSEITDLNWSAYEGEIPDTRDNAADLFDLSRYKFVFIFVDGNEIRKVSPVSHGIELNGESYIVGGGDYLRCMKRGSVFVRKNNSDFHRTISVHHRKAY